jgi:hypothetical protein
MGCVMLAKKGSIRRQHVTVVILRHIPMKLYGVCDRDGHGHVKHGRVAS